MDACHYLIVQTYRMYNTKSKIQCTVWTLGNTEACLYVISYNKHTTLVGDTDMERACMCGDRNYMWNYVSFIHFCYELETDLKREVQLKKWNCRKMYELHKPIMDMLVSMEKLLYTIKTGF